MKAERFLKFITSLLIVIFFNTCSDEEPLARSYPRVKTVDVINISEEGVTFVAELNNEGNYEIIEHGFVWSESLNPTVDYSDKIVLGDKISNGQFSAKITNALQEGKNYIVRAYIKTKTHLVYGKNLTFFSLGSNAPIIEDFHPKTGVWGDTIFIKGSNFSYLEDNNKVKMGTINSQVISATDSTITIIVPSIKNNHTVQIAVSIKGNSTLSTDNFKYLIPKINSIIPTVGTFGDTITISGENFNRIEKYNTVKISGLTAEIVSFSTSEIKFLVPDELTTSKNSMTLISSEEILPYHGFFLLNPPIILSFDPEIATRPNEIITISGLNFNPIVSKNNVEIAGLNSEIIEASNDFLKVRLPNEVIPDYYVSVFKNVSFNVTVLDQKHTSPKDLEIYWQSAWTKKVNFPGLARHSAVAFSINDKGYFGTGLSGLDLSSLYLNDFWEYDPATDIWTQITDLPGLPRASASSFIIEEEGYVGLGSEDYYWNDSDNNQDHFSDFYKYNPSAGTWSQTSDFAGIGRYSAASFSINNKGYVVTGVLEQIDPVTGSWIANDTWRFDPALNQWTEINKYPKASYTAAGFAIGNDGYIYDNNKLYKLIDNNWLEIESNLFGMSEVVAFSINELMYYGLGKTPSAGGTSSLWEFDPLTGLSKNIPMAEGNTRWGSSVFVINGKAYIIGGRGYTYLDGNIILNDVWEFDPSKPNL